MINFCHDMSRFELKNLEYYVRDLLENNKLKKLRLPIDWIHILFENSDIKFTTILIKLEIELINDYYKKEISFQKLLSLFPNLEILKCFDLKIFTLDLIKPHYNCKEFHFYFPEREPNEDWIQIFDQTITNLPNLVHFGINWMPIFNHTILQLLSKLTKLESLMFNISNNISDNLNSIGNNCSNLSTLTVRNDDHVENNNFNYNFLILYKSLTSLAVSSFNFNDESVQYLCNSPNIIQLSLRHVNLTFNGYS